MLDHPHNSWFSRSLQIHEPIQLHMTEIMNHLQNREPLPNPSAPAPWPQPHQKNAINQILEITSECNTIMKWQNNTPETREIDRSVVETRQLRHGCRVSSSLRPKTIGVGASTIRLGFQPKIYLSALLFLEMLSQRLQWSVSSNRGFGPRERDNGALHFALRKDSRTWILHLSELCVPPRYTCHHMDHLQHVKGPRSAITGCN